MTHVCYLDDSSNSGIVSSLGGYIATRGAWEHYESLAKSIYQSFGLQTLHTKDLHGSKREFKDWSFEKKSNFVEELFDAAKACEVVGVSACVRNSLGKKFNQSNRHTARLSTLGLLFARVLMSINTKGSVYDNPPDEVDFVIEAGNTNNKGLRTHFDEVKENGRSFDFAKSLAFVGKKECYAIQLADFWAFYSRRKASKTLNGEKPLEVHEAMTIQEAFEGVLPIAGYRCVHHMKLINKIELCKKTGGVLTIADSYTSDPDDFGFVPVRK